MTIIRVNRREKDFGKIYQTTFCQPVFALYSASIRLVPGMNVALSFLYVQ